MDGIEDVRWLLGTENRIRLLKELNERPGGPVDLAETADVSRSTVQRTLSEFIERGWARKRGRTYERTSAGDLFLQVCLDLLEDAETVTSASEFLSSFSGTDLNITVERLTNATIVESRPRRPHGPLRHYVTQLENRSPDSFRRISPVVSPVLRDIHGTLFEETTKAELIIDPEMIDVLRRSDVGELQKSIRNDDLLLYVTPEPTKFGLTILDDRLFIGAYNGEQIDARLESGDAEWYTEVATLFDRYRRESNIVEADRLSD